MTRTNRQLLMLAGAGASAMLCNSAWAQSTASTAPDVLAEVVVTATRQSDSVNRVPLSVSAVTQETLDKQGVKTVSDLARVVPGLTFTTTGGDSVPHVSIRGITNSAGSQTTAIYLDDAPLQGRGLGGSPVTGAGTSLPQLFDLERVEILKGPQGTLYGGSAEGGAVRFITPTPSLTTFSGMAKVEASALKYGSPGADIGVAVGGPIIEDKLGVRFSFRQRRAGGYIDDVSRFDGHVVDKDTNWNTAKAFRGSMLWKPTERLSITPSVYFTAEKSGDQDGYWLNNPTATTIPTRMFTAGGAPTTDPTQAALTVPAHTYGPYNMFGLFRSGQVTNVGDNYAGQIPLKGLRNGNHRNLRVFANNAQYDFDNFKVNLISSHLNNQSKGQMDVSFIPVYFAYGYPYQANLPLAFTTIEYDTHRKVDTNEIRFSSKAGDRLSWVGGVYYSKSNMRSYAPSYWNANEMYLAASNLTDVQIFGVPLLNKTSGLTGVRDQRVQDEELAAYVNADYMLTDKLKVTAGLRLSEVTVAFQSYNYGQATGTSVATAANGGYVTGETTEKPITPKVGVSYQFDSDLMMYANAAKGFRPGGINLPASASLCAGDFAALGVKSTPLAYASDSVWSYEGGVKARLFDRAQLNASLFYIDWSEPQTTVTLPSCGNSYLINAGKAVSKGFDAQLTAKVVGGLSVSGALAYTDAYQKQRVGLDTPTKPTFVVPGDGLGVPKWTYSVSAQYDYDLLGRYPAYVRVDYQYTGEYKRGSGPGTVTYNPYGYEADATSFVTARAAVTFNATELSVFVNNLTNSQDILGESNFAAIAQATTFRPREIGASLAYKF